MLTFDLWQGYLFVLGSPRCSSGGQIPLHEGIRGSGTQSTPVNGRLFPPTSGPWAWWVIHRKQCQGILWVTLSSGTDSYIGIDKMIDLLIFLLFYSSFTKWFFWKLICNNFSRLLINDFVLFTVGLNFWGWKYYFMHCSRPRIHWRGFCYTMYIYLHFICHVFFPTGLWWGF